MPAQGVETISLNLDGNFAAKAKEDAAAGQALVGALDKVGAAAAGIKAPALGDTGAGIKTLGAGAAASGAGVDKLGAAVKDLPQLKKIDGAAGIKALGEDAKKTAADLDKLKSSSAAPFGPIAPPKSDKQKEREKAFDMKFRAAEAADAAGEIKKGAESGKTSMTLGAEAIKGAVRYLGEKGVEFVSGAVSWAAQTAAAALKFGVEQSAAADKQEEILDKLTGGQGELAYRMSLSLGGETGQTPATALERLKGLIGAKFSQEEIPLIFKAAADLGEVKGQEKGKGFLEQLEKAQAKGKANEESLNGLAEAGVNAEAVLEQLAQKGEALDSVRTRLKLGQIAAKDFTLAAAGAVAKDFGGLAGKGLDATINRMKIAGADLFRFDTGPLDELGGKINAALGGETGAELKKQLSAAGSEVIKLVGNITAADIKSVFSAAGSAATTLASGIKTAADAAMALWNFAKRVSGSGSHTEGGSSGDAEGDAIEQEIAAGNRRAFIREQEIEKAKAHADKMKAAADAASPVAGGAGPADAAAGGAATGAALAAGLKKGIDDNANKPAAAAAAMVAGAIKAGDEAAQIKSPSRVEHRRGGYIAEGLAGGIDDSADKPERSAADMMRRVTRAGGEGGASPGLPGSSASGAQGNSSGPPVVIHVAVQTSPGMTTGHATAIGDAAGAAAYLAWQAHKRRDARDQQEARS